jgi:hypothetical protein
VELRIVADLNDPRWVLQRHIRQCDGTCRGCYVDLNKTSRWPCQHFDYAAGLEGRRMTAEFLFGTTNQQPQLYSVKGDHQ